MHGDFSLDPLAHATEDLLWLQQQGRVHRDPDWNQQMSALVDYLRGTVEDMLDGDAATDEGFLVSNVDPGGAGGAGEFSIGVGRMYASGYRCVATDDVPPGGPTYQLQPWRLDGARSSGWPDELPQGFFVYLDVWLQHRTFRQDASIGEIALGDVDTTTRASVIWQVKVVEVQNAPAPVNNSKALRAAFESLVAPLRLTSGTLSVVSTTATSPGEPCLDDAVDGHVGPGNQLYRVEVHQSGSIGDASRPTFKWDRDNGSVTWTIDSAHGTTVTIVPAPGPEPAAGDLVELVDAASELSDAPEPQRLRTVRSFDRSTRRLTLDDDPGIAYDQDEARTAHALLRRWCGTGDITADAIQLEAGLTVRFTLGSGPYRARDYWLIPMRVAAGGPIWPVEAVGPHGVRHHWVPLAYVANSTEHDARRKILPPVIESQ